MKGIGRMCGAEDVAVTSYVSHVVIPTGVVSDVLSPWIHVFVLFLAVPTIVELVWAAIAIGWRVKSGHRW